MILWHKIETNKSTEYWWDLNLNKFALLWGEAQLSLLIEKKVMTFSDPMVTYITLKWPIVALTWPNMNYSGLKVNHSCPKVTYSYYRVTYSDPKMTYSDPKVTYSDPKTLKQPKKCF